MRAFASVAFVLLLAGCVAAAPKDVDDAPARGVVPDASLASPSGATAHELLYEFAMGHPNRHNENMAAKRAAQDYLASELEARGLRVERHEYSSTGTNIVGYLDGATAPDEWVVLSCHADVIRSTVYGARDDGLGCAALLEMSRAFAETRWNRTLVFAFFDEEELGLLGARAFVKDFGVTDGSTVVANLNYDPAGLHHPCGDAAGTYPVWLLITESKLADGASEVPGYQNVLDAARSGYLAAGVPESKIRVDTSHAYARAGDQTFLPPGSDDDAFDEADIPSIWFGAPPADEVGPLLAWGYPNHVPADTADVVEARCGSVDLLQGGLQTVMDATLLALIELDAETWG